MNEKHHAFLSATFFDELTRTCPDQAATVFSFATRKYGEQRGSRMAQRALRDGQPLTYSTYSAYGEVEYTEDDFRAGKYVEVLSEHPDHEYLISRCPWEEQYVAMGLRQGAIHYCDNIDLAVLRGFNPFLKLEVKGTLHTAGRCHFVFQGIDRLPPSCGEDRSKPFDYHCGHLFKTFSEVVEGILGTSGRTVIDRVADKVRGAFGEEILQRILSYRNTRFDLIVEEG